MFFFLGNEILLLLLTANVKGLPVGVGAVGLIINPTAHKNYCKKFNEPSLEFQTDLGFCRNLHSSQKLQLCEIITMMMMMVGVVYLKGHTLQLNLCGCLHFKE